MEQATNNHLVLLAPQGRDTEDRSATPALRKLITEFFSDHGTHQSRRTLLNLLCTSIKGNFHQLEPLQMAELVAFYESLDALLSSLAVEMDGQLPA